MVSLKGLFSVAAGLLLLVGPSAAQEEDSSLVDFLEKMDQLVVSIADLTGSALAETPASVTVFTRQDLSNLGIDRLGDLLNLVPGMQTNINTVTQGQLDYVVSRGSAGYGNDVLIMLNGQRINSMHDNSAGLFHPYIDLGNAERVEIMRGPASSLYGSNSVTGVINIITELEDRTAAGQFGEHNSQQANVQYGQAMGSWRWHFYGRTAEDRGDHYKAFNPHSEFNDVATREHAVYLPLSDPRQVMDTYLQLAFKQSFKADLSFSKRSLHDYYVFAGGIVPGINRDESSALMTNLQWNIKGPGSMRGSFALKYQEGKKDALHSPFPQGFAFAQEADFLGGPYWKHRMLEFFTDWRYQPNENYRWVFGTSFSAADNPTAFSQRNYNLFVNPPQYLERVHLFSEDDDYRFVKDEKQEIKSAFVQLERAMRNHWKAVIGMRWDSFNFGGSNLSPRVSLIYRPNFANTVKLVSAQAFRGPGLGDLFEQNNLVSGGNPNLKATAMDHLEMIYQFTSPLFTITASLYEDHYEDVITLGPNPNPEPGQARNLFLNAGTQHVEGAELAINWLPWGNIHLMANYTHLFSTHTGFEVPEDFERPEAFIAQRFGAIIVNIDSDIWNFNLSGHVRSRIEALPDQHTLHIFSSKFSFQLKQDFDIFIKADNIFDQMYASPALGAGLGRDPSGQIVRELPMRGRWLYLGFKYNLR